MGSVSSASSNLSDLLQTLSTESPELSSVLSTPQVQSALEKAPPSDLVQLSDQAMQLQQMSLLFGLTDGTQSNPLTSGFDPLLASLSPNTTLSPQAQEVQGLFGIPPPTDPSVNTIG